MDESKENGVADGGGGKFVITVNGGQFQTDESVWNGGQILEKAGFQPAREHVLIDLLLPGTRSVGLDEQIDLGLGGSRAFQAFKSDRIFRFTIDDRSYEWGVGKIAEPELRRIAAMDGDETLVLERDGKAIDLASDAVVDLGETGTECLRSVRLVTVYLNDDVEKKIPRGTYSTEELIRLLGVERGYLLNVLDEQGRLTLLKPGEMTQVKAGMKFYSQVPSGGSS